MGIIKVKNVMKVIDINYHDIDEHAVAFLNNYIIYKDTVLNEHLISINDAIEDLRYTSFEIVCKQVKCLHTLAEKHDASYVRLIT